MKKFFTFIILPFLFFSLSSCRADSLKFYEHGKYEKAIELTNSLDHPSSEDYLAKAKSLCALDKENEAYDSILMYLLTTDRTSKTLDREFAINLFLKNEYSDSINILCLVPEDGLDAQIKLYKSYTRVGDQKNAKQILDLFLSSSLSLKDLVNLVIDFPTEPTYVAGLFEAWSEKLISEEKEEFSKLLFKFINSSTVTEQASRVVIHLCQDKENDPYFLSKNTYLELLYRTHAKALEVLNDKKNADLFREKANRLNRIKNGNN